MLSKIFNLKNCKNKYQKISSNEIIEKEHLIIPQFTDNNQRWNWLNEKIDCEEVHQLIKREIEQISFGISIDQFQSFDDIPELLKNKKIIEYDIIPIPRIYIFSEHDMHHIFINKIFIKVLSETNDIEKNIEKYQQILLNISCITELHKYTTIFNYMLIHKKELMITHILKYMVRYFNILASHGINNNFICVDTNNIFLIIEKLNIDHGRLISLFNCNKSNEMAYLLLKFFGKYRDVYYDVVCQYISIKIININKLTEDEKYKFLVKFEPSLSVLYKKYNEIEKKLDKIIENIYIKEKKLDKIIENIYIKEKKS